MEEHVSYINKYFIYCFAKTTLSKLSKTIQHQIMKGLFKLTEKYLCKNKNLNNNSIEVATNEITNRQIELWQAFRFYTLIYL